MLKQKVIVISGGAGLIGSIFSKAVAAHGGIVIVADIDINAANNIAEEIISMGGQAKSVELNITDKSSIIKLIEGIDGHYGRIDAIVNNAYPRNKNYNRKLEDVSYLDFTENIDLHLGGYFLMSQQFSLYFLEKGGGNIVNMASIYGVVAPRFGIYENTLMTMPVEYAAIKASVIHLTKYFAQYYKGTNIRCNSLSPGGILNQQADAFIKKYNSYCARKGMLDAEDLAGTFIYLLSDASKYVTGQNFIVDDGFSL